jgi:DNA (cytosine-5)-methyltransferase 1
VVAYYNENDPYAAQWLRNLIATGFIPDGHVDERSIIHVLPADLIGYRQCHFFSGLGGWPRALRLAGWPDDRRVWTGSCPCQPFSLAGKQQGTDDDRHLWPAWFSLISECHPAIIFGEQVAAAVGKGWLDEVFDDLEGEGYACGAAILPACGVGAPHKRDRLWFVANSNKSRGRQEREQRSGEQLWACGNPQESDSWRSTLADSNIDPWQQRRSGDTLEGQRRWDADRGGVGPDVCNTHESRLAIWQSERSDARSKQPAAIGADWWAVEPDVGRVAHGIPARVGKLRALGNAIVPQVAAEFVMAAMETIQ